MQKSEKSFLQTMNVRPQEDGQQEWPVYLCVCLCVRARDKSKTKCVADP